MAGALVSAQLVFTPDGNLAQATPFTVWDEAESGSDISSGCTAPDGTSAAALATHPDGLSPAFRLPDGAAIGFIDIGAGARQSLIPAQTVRDAALAPAIATAARAAAVAAQAAAETAQTTAEQAASQVNTAAAIDGGSF